MALRVLWEFNTNEVKAVTLGRKSSHTDVWDFGSVSLTPQPPHTTPIDRSLDRSPSATKPSVMTGRQTSSLCAGYDSMHEGLACFSGVLVLNPGLDLIHQNIMRYMVKHT